LAGCVDSQSDTGDPALQITKKATNKGLCKNL